MKNTALLKRILFALLLVLLIPAVCCCAKNNSVGAETDLPSAERVLRLMIEYPGDGLYDAADEKTAWQDAAGGCFADGMFDEFYDSFDRTSFLSEARNLKLTTKVTDISGRPGDDSWTVTVEATDETGHTDTYETVWRVQYESEENDLLKSVELLADGGYFCRAGCPL